MKKIVTIILACVLIISAMLLLFSCDDGVEKETEKNTVMETEKPTETETETEKPTEPEPEPEPETNGKYFKVEGTAIIGLTEEGKKLEKIVIPAEIGGVKITEIKEFAFSDPEGNPENLCTNLTYVEIGNNVENIGMGAFGGYTNLKTVNSEKKFPA